MFGKDDDKLNQKLEKLTRRVESLESWQFSYKMGDSRRIDNLERRLSRYGVRHCKKCGRETLMRYVCGVRDDSYHLCLTCGTKWQRVTEFKEYTEGGE